MVLRTGCLESAVQPSANGRLAVPAGGLLEAGRPPGSDLSKSTTGLMAGGTEEGRGEVWDWLPEVVGQDYITKNSDIQYLQYFL